MPPYGHPHSRQQDENHATYFAISSAPYMDNDHQPGLEVASEWDERRTTPGLQVTGPHLHLKNGSSEPEVTNHSDFHSSHGLYPLVPEGPVEPNAPKQADSAWGEYTAAGEAVQAEKARRKKRWRLWGIVSVIAVLVVVGATVGGVLGSKASAEDRPISPGSIRRNSRLAVTGIRYNDNNYTLRLFSQDVDNTLNYVEKNSFDSEWSKACQLKNTLNHTPKENGSIAACMQRISSSGNQWILVYMDETSTLRSLGFYITGSTESRGQNGRLSSQAQPVIADANSRLGCFWPYIMSQDADGQLRWTEFVGPNTPSGDDWYRNDTDIGAKGSEGTGMVPLPITQPFRTEAGFVYRGTDGRLTTGVKVYNTTESPEWGRSQPSIAIAPESAIAAFSVGRDNTPDLVNTYILYQDGAGVIQVVWRDGKDGNDWKGPKTYPALDNAEIGTDIACATMGGGNVGGGSSFTVSKQQDMNRCFFQEKGTGRLKEVWFNGTDWENVRFVPIEYGDGNC